MMREVFLYGVAGRTFGRRFRLDVASPAEAIRAISALRPGFGRVLRDGMWRVIVGPPRLRYSIEGSHLGMNAGSQPIHIVPATGAAGEGGVGKVIVGVVLVGAAIALSPFTGGASFAAAMATEAFWGVTYGTIALMGVASVLGGVAALLTTPPSRGAMDQPTSLAPSNDRPSFLFNGVTNNSQQGGPVPLVFGTHLAGSVVVSAGLNAEDIA